MIASELRGQISGRFRQITDAEQLVEAVVICYRARRFWCTRDELDTLGVVLREEPRVKRVMGILANLCQAHAENWSPSELARVVRCLTVDLPS